MQKRHTLILLALTLILLIGAGAYFFTSSELLQGRFGNNFGPPQILDTDIKGNFTVNNNQEDNKEPGDDSLRETLHELSQINPRIYYLYKDNLELFEEKLNQGLFENIEAPSNEISSHGTAPQTNEDILKSMLNYYETVDIDAYHFEEAFPEFFQDSQFKVMVEDTEFTQFKIQENSLIFLDEIQKNKDFIELQMSEESFLKLNQGPVDFNAFFLEGNVQMTGKNEGGQIDWELRWNSETNELFTQTTTGEILWQMKLQ